MNTTTFRLIPALGLATALLGAALAQTSTPATPPATFPEQDSPYDYLCATDIPLVLTYGTEAVTLELDGEIFELTLRPAAGTPATSERQYENVEEKLVWTSQGQEGYLERDGQRVADDCAVVLAEGDTTPTADAATTTPPTDATTTPPADATTPPADATTPPADATTTPPADATTTPPADTTAQVTPQSTSPDTTLDPAALEGAWNLYYVGVNGEFSPVTTQTRPSLTFVGGQLNANTGCNQANGTVALEGGAVVVQGPITSTKRACASETATQLETTLLGALEGQHIPTLRDYGAGLKTLVLKKEDGTTLILVASRTATVTPQ